MSDMLSKEEMNALLGGDDETSSSTSDTVILTDRQKDILGEIGNIIMGTSATTLSTLLNNKVIITTPNVSTMTWQEISDSYDKPCVGVKIDYTIGMKGSNVLVLRNLDVKIIADLMMGGGGKIDEALADDITELELSAIGEAMNQMIGSSATSMSSMMKERIDIATPSAFRIDFSDAAFYENFGFSESPVVVTTFSFKVGELLDSEIMQILPPDFAMEMSEKLYNDIGISSPPPPPPPLPPPPPPPPIQESMMQQSMPPHYGMYPDQAAMANQYYAQGPMNMQPTHFSQQNINAKPAQFQNFDVASVTQQKENMDILMDVPLEVTVELGKTSKRIREILEFSPGTIIELDKLAGEPIDILVNGKYVAKGEVVVIDENFGIRVTNIISPEFRI